VAGDPSRPELVGTGRRRLLTVFLLLHWGAVAAYVLPSTRDALEPFPDALEPLAGKVIPKAVILALPVAEPYWNLTATRQAWTLFAPWPSAWGASVRVVPYFPTEEGGGWRADTVRVEGAAERPYPHLLRHRSYRILFNLGYQTWEVWYRPFFAREMCGTLTDREGRRPEGVTLHTLWTPIRVPWADGGEEPYLQRLGGYDCSALRPVARAPWREYGLPDVVDTRDWPVERAPSGGTPPADTLPSEGAAHPPRPGGGA